MCEQRQRQRLVLLRVGRRPQQQQLRARRDGFDARNGQRDARGGFDADGSHQLLQVAQLARELEQGLREKGQARREVRLCAGPLFSVLLLCEHRMRV